MLWRTNAPKDGFVKGVVCFDSKVTNGPDMTGTSQMTDKLMFPEVVGDTEERIENRLRFAWPGLHRRVRTGFVESFRAVGLHFGGEPGLGLTVVNGRLAVTSETYCDRRGGGYGVTLQDNAIRTTGVGVGSSLYRMRKRVRLDGTRLYGKVRGLRLDGAQCMMLDTELLEAYATAVDTGKLKSGMRTFDVFECKLSAAFDQGVPHKEANHVVYDGWEVNGECMLIPLYDKVYCRYGFVAKSDDSEGGLLQLGYAPHVVVVPSGRRFHMVLRYGNDMLVSGGANRPEIDLGYTTNLKRASARVSTCIMKALMNISQKGITDSQAEDIRDVLGRKYYKVVPRPMGRQEMHRAVELMIRRELEEQKWAVRKMYIDTFEDLISETLPMSARRLVLRGYQVPMEVYSDPSCYGVQAYMKMQHKFDAFITDAGDNILNPLGCPLRMFNEALSTHVKRADSLKSLTLLEQRVVRLLKELDATIESLKGEHHE